MNFEINGDQAATVELALRVAAAVYDQHAVTAEGAKQPALAEQFTRQAAEARELQARVVAELF